MYHYTQETIRAKRCSGLRPCRNDSLYRIWYRLVYATSVQTFRYILNRYYTNIQTIRRLNLDSRKHQQSGYYFSRQNIFLLVYFLGSTFLIGMKMLSNVSPSGRSVIPSVNMIECVSCSPVQSDAAVPTLPFRTSVSLGRLIKKLRTSTRVGLPSCARCTVQAKHGFPKIVIRHRRY